MSGTGLADLYNYFQLSVFSVNDKTGRYLRVIRQLRNAVTGMGESIATAEKEVSPAEAGAYYRDALRKSYETEYLLDLLKESDLLTAANEKIMDVTVKNMQDILNEKVAEADEAVENSKEPPPQDEEISDFLASLMI